MNEHNLNLDDFTIDEIESIELMGDEDTIDITVADTHMFFANDIYTHNSSIKAEVVESDQMGGSIKKGQIGHFVCSIAKTLDQKENGTATIAILKSRFGKDGIIFSNILFDNARIQIEMEENSSGRARSEHKSDIEETKQQRVSAVFEAAKRLRDEALTRVIQ